MDSLPILLANCEPELSQLPLFVIRLATEVNWKDEKQCFEGVCRQLALLYAARERPEAQEDAAAQTDSWLVEHVLYGAFRSMLLVGGECERGSVFKLVDLARLYRVFERC